MSYVTTEELRAMRMPGELGTFDASNADVLCGGCYEEWIKAAYVDENACEEPSCRKPLCDRCVKHDGLGLTWCKDHIAGRMEEIRGIDHGIAAEDRAAA